MFAVSRKRPYSSEGHLRLGSFARSRGGTPRPDAHARSPAVPDSVPENIAVLLPERGQSAWGRVLGDALADWEVCDGDRAVIAARRHAEYGDLVVVPVGVLPQDERCALDEDTLTVWKAYPERDRLVLSSGTRKVTVDADARIAGVVVAVLRRLR